MSTPDFKSEDGRDYQRGYFLNLDGTGCWGWVQLPGYEVWQGIKEGEQ